MLATLPRELAFKHGKVHYSRLAKALVKTSSREEWPNENTGPQRRELPGWYMAAPLGRRKG